MKSLDVLELLESLASDQWGIITTAQAVREGVSRLQISRLSEQDVLTRARRGVYLLPSAQYGPLTDIRTAWVSLGSDRFPFERLDAAEDVFVSHESAAHIHQIGDLIPDKIFFSTAARKQTAQKDIHVYNHREVGAGDIDNIDGLPVASVERTVADLATTKIEFNYLATLVTDALRKEGVRLKNLANSLEQSAHSYGFQSGRQLVHACQDEAESDEDNDERYDRVAHQIWTRNPRFMKDAEEILSRLDPARLFEQTGAASFNQQLMANLSGNWPAEIAAQAAKLNRDLGR